MIAIVDYGCGNLHSVMNAFTYLGEEAVITSDENKIIESERIVIPGVGSFMSGMENLMSTGLIDCLNQQVLDLKKPVLGICLGQQLMATTGLEGSTTAGLGWIAGKVEKLETGTNPLPLPHVGWNEVYPTKQSKLFEGLGKSPIFYFTHSYAINIDGSNELVAGWCEYGIPFTAAIESGNNAATQFHPEKSQDAGLSFLSNFVNWEP